MIVILTPRILEEGLSDLVRVLNKEFGPEMLNNVFSLGRSGEGSGIKVKAFSGGITRVTAFSACPLSCLIRARRRGR